MNRKTRLNNHRRSVLLTRKQQVRDLQSDRFREVGDYVVNKIAPQLADLERKVVEMVKEEVQRALEGHGLIK